MTKPDPSNDGTDQDQDQETLQAILAGLHAGATIGDLKGIDADMLEGVYALAYRFYRNGQLDEAETFFRFLCLYDFYNAEYALGLAAVLQLKRDYGKAIGMYAVAQTLDLKDDRPMFHVGQCQLALGKLAVARDCFQSVARRAAGSELGTRAEAYLQAMRGELERRDEAAAEGPDFSGPISLSTPPTGSE